MKHENPLPISTRSRPAMWALALSLWAGGVGLAVAAPTRTPQEAAVPGLVASAQADAGLARAELDRFKALYKTRRFAQAYEAAATAFSAGGGSEALECVGVSALNLGRIELAHQAYGAILLDAGADAGLRTRAGNQIAALNLQTGQIHLPASPAETNVFLDGAFVTTLPAERTLRALPGRHVVRFEREGEPDREVVVRTAAGRTVRVEAVPVPAEVAAAAPAQAAVAPPAPAQAAVAPPAPPPPAPGDAVSALDRFARAFKAGRMADAFEAAEKAVLAGAGADAFEAKGAAALRLGRIDTAHQAYAAVLADPAAKPDVRGRAENQLRALDWQTGEVVLDGGPAGAVVELDGFPVGRLPLGRTLRALPGEHRLRITRPDAPPFASKVRVTAQRTASVVVPAGPEAAAPPPVASASTPSPAPAPAAPAAPPPRNRAPDLLTESARRRGSPRTALAAGGPPHTRTRCATGLLRASHRQRRPAGRRRLEPPHLGQPLVRQERRALSLALPRGRHLPGEPAEPDLGGLPTRRRPPGPRRARPRLLLGPRQALRRRDDAHPGRPHPGQPRLPGGQRLQGRARPPRVPLRRVQVDVGPQPARRLLAHSHPHRDARLRPVDADRRV